ncbi:MAG: hypothetical protein ACXWUX_16175 [Allosphingosinicella sp.]
MEHGGAAFVLILAVVLGGPLLLGLAGLLRGPAPAGGGRRPWDWRVTLRSALLYALAFNLVFFIQELFLVVPKALTPGLRPTLYHNNHGWDGEHPLAHLFQGTGALAILLTGLLFAWLIRRGAGRSANARLLIVWMAFHGLFQSLPQLVVGAIVPENDVGMAMDYLGLSPAAKAAAAVVALVAIVWTGLRLTRSLLALADDDERIAGAGARTRFIFLIATLPALIGIALIIPFRVPRELIEVIVPPIAVTLVGIGWIQANAWREAQVQAAGARWTARSPVRSPP